MFHFNRKRSLKEKKELERKEQEAEKKQSYLNLLHEINESVSIEKEFTEKMYI